MLSRRSFPISHRQSRSVSDGKPSPTKADTLLSLDGIFQTDDGATTCEEQAEPPAKPPPTKNTDVLLAHTYDVRRTKAKLELLLVRIRLGLVCIERRETPTVCGQCEPKVNREVIKNHEPLRRHQGPQAVSKTDSNLRA